MLKDIYLHLPENERQRLLLINNGAEYFIRELNPQELPIEAAFNRDNTQIFFLLSRLGIHLSFSHLLYSSVLEYALVTHKYRIAEQLVNSHSISHLHDLLKRRLISNSITSRAFLAKAIKNHANTIEKNNERLSLQFIKSLEDLVLEIKKELLEAAKYSFLEAWKYLLQLNKVEDCLASAKNLHYNESYYQTDENNYHTNQLKAKLENETYFPDRGIKLTNDEVAYALAESILTDKTFLNLNLDVFSFSKKNKIQLLLCFLREGSQQDQDHHLLRRAFYYLKEKKGALPLPTLQALISDIDEHNINYEKLIIDLSDDSKEFWKIRDALYKKAHQLFTISLDHPDLPSLHDKILREAEKYLEQAPKKATKVKKIKPKPIRGIFIHETTSLDHLNVELISKKMTDMQALIDELDNLIIQLSTYGKTLPDDKRHHVDDLVNQLQTELNDFKDLVTKSPREIEHEFPLFHETMKNILNKKQFTEPLYNHRNELKIWLTNIALALTGIGLIAVIVNIARTALQEPNEARPSFTHLLFFGKTSTQKKMMAIEEAMTNRAITCATC